MKLIFKSLINNAACVTGARKKSKWWVSLLLLLVTLIFAVVPSFVMTITQKGSSVLFPSSFNKLDNAFYHFVEDNSSSSFVIKDGTEKNSKKLDVHGFTSYTYTLEGSTTNFIYSETGNDVTFPEKQSSVLFTSTGLFVVISNGSENVSAISCVNAWKDFDSDTDLFNYLLSGLPDSPTENDKYVTVKNNLTNLINTAYVYTKVVTSFQYMGIYSAINLLISLLMGFMVWILSRGKQNSFRHFTIIDCFKISFWAGLAPGILTLGIGFLISRLANMCFPLLLGVRCMWLCSNTLRPDGTGYVEPKEVPTVNVKSK